MVGVPVVVHVSHLWNYGTDYMSEMPPCGNEKLSHQKVMGAYFKIVYFM
jgi:hypothetical protein